MLQYFEQFVSFTTGSRAISSMKSEEEILNFIRERPGEVKVTVLTNKVCVVFKSSKGVAPVVWVSRAFTPRGVEAVMNYLMREINKIKRKIR